MPMLRGEPPKRPRKWPSGTEIVTPAPPDRRLELPGDRGQRVELGPELGAITCVDGDRDPETAAGELIEGPRWRQGWPLWAQIVGAMAIIVAVGVLMNGCSKGPTAENASGRALELVGPLSVADPPQTAVSCEGAGRRSAAACMVAIDNRLVVEVKCNDSTCWVSRILPFQRAADALGFQPEVPR